MSDNQQQDQQQSINDPVPVEQNPVQAELEGVQEKGQPENQEPLINWQVAIWEMIGTAIFAHGICASNGTDYFITISLLGAIILIQPFSGGHVNPAVSLAFWLKGDYGLAELFTRAIAQTVGALVGGFLAFLILDQVAAPSVPVETFWWVMRDILGETIGTFVFVLTILIVCDSESGVNSHLKTTEYFKYNLMRFVIIVLGLHLGRALTYRSGGGLNPAIALGLELWLSIYTEDFSYMINFYIFLIGPLLGAWLAYIWYTKVHLKSLDKKEEQQVQDQKQQE